MAVTFDANLGSADFNINLAGSPENLTTTAAAAAGSRIFVLISYFDGSNNSRVTAITGGGTYAKDKQVVNGDDIFEIWSADSAAGLASGQTIALTISPTSAGGGLLVGAFSMLGVATGAGGIDTTSSSTGTGTGWSSGAATNSQADAVYVGGSGNEDATNPTTSTATSGTEVHDRYRASDGQGLVTGYKIVSSIASDSVTGNFSNANSTANTGGLVIYKASGAAAAAITGPSFQAIPFMR